MKQARAATWAVGVGLAVLVSGCSRMEVSSELDGIGASTRPARAAATRPATTQPAETPTPQLSVVVVTLRQCLEWALENNLRLSVERLTPGIRDAQIVEALSVFDTVFGTSATFSGTDVPATNVFAGGDSVKTDVTALDWNLQKRLVTGAAAKVDFNWDHAWTDSIFFMPNPRQDANLSAGIGQPLLRDFGLGVNTAAIRIARNTKRGSVFQFRKTVEDTLQAVEETYWALYLAIEELKVRQRQLVRAKDLLQRAKNLVAAGKVAPVEEIAAEAEVARVDGDIIQAEDTVSRAENALKRLLHHPTLPLTAATRIVPADGPGDAPLRVDSEGAVAAALVKRPDFLAARLEEENSNIRVKVAKNQLLPRLDLAFQYALHGIGPDTGSALEDVGGFKYQDKVVSLTAQIPLGNRAAKSRLEQARLGREQVIRSIADLQEQIILDVRNIVRAAATDHAKLDAARNAVRLSAARLANEEKLYNNERSTRTDVLQAQTDLAESELNEIRAIISLNVDIARFFRLQGTYLERNRIAIDEAPGN
jgi:outer membrane protein